MIPKFRAWDKKKNEMFNVIAVNMKLKRVYETWNEDGMNLFASLDSTILMQSTGLRDKNGKEIFEGDVVECYTEGLSVVEFAGGVFGLRCNGYFEGFNLVNGQCVIIGNIHEHSHLLDDGGIRE